MCRDRYDNNQRYGYERKGDRDRKHFLTGASHKTNSITQQHYLTLNHLNSHENELDMKWTDITCNILSGKRKPRQQECHIQGYIYHYYAQQKIPAVLRL